MIGKLLGGRYEILEEIGGGGMAKVYKAKCTVLNRYVAIKVLRDEFVEDEEFVDKFRRESQAAASLSHPNIVNIYDVGTDKTEKTIHYIVMEYIDGKTLKEVINETGRLTNEEVIDYSTQIAYALKAAHSNNIIHRDIKPQNIMLDKDGRIKVMDFGIARAATSSTITTTSEALGSVHYFSPEQARGGYTDEKSDIYSLGIVMYEMITGRVPYDGESPITVALKHVQETITPPREVEPTVPEDIERIILKAIEKRQMDRYLNMDEMIGDLENLVRKYNILMIGKEKNLSKIEDNKDHMSETQVIPNIKAEAKNKKLKNKKEDPEDIEDIDEKPKKSKGGIIAGVLLAFLLTFAAFFGKDIVGKLIVKEEVEMINLVGMTIEAAEKQLKDKNLDYKIIATVKDSEYGPGIVVKQDIPEGAKLKPGFPVGLTVSAESDMVKMPSLVGKSIYEAEMILRREGLSIGSRRDVESEHFEEETVIEQGISPGDDIPRKTKVDLVISKGKKDQAIEMPNLTGQTMDNAKSKLEELGLKVGRVDEKESDHDKGIIIWQSYKEGSELSKGTQVNFQVSKGKPVEKEDNKEEEKEDNKEDKNEENKPVEKSRVITVNGGTEGAVIQIDRISNGVKETVFSESVIGEKSITVKGPEGSTFDIYYDGVHEGSMSN